jgi:hypothetical protein
MEGHAHVQLSGHLHHMASRKSDANLFDNIAVKRVQFGDLLWRNRFITSSVMLRRDLPIRFEDGQRHMEDHRLWLDAARAGYGIVRLEAPLAFHHKPDFGAGGLSANLAAMERAELSNYLSLYRNKAFGRLRLAVLWCWSVAKFARRLAIVSMRRLS